jgi:Domain of unknown function (DUF397)
MHDDLPRAQWRKSSYSGNTGNCVEVAIKGSAVAVRDSKDPDGPKLTFTCQDWAFFIRRLKDGEHEVR